MAVLRPGRLFAIKELDYSRLDELIISCYCPRQVVDLFVDAYENWNGYVLLALHERKNVLKYPFRVWNTGRVVLNCYRCGIRRGIIREKAFEEIDTRYLEITYIVLKNHPFRGLIYPYDDKLIKIDRITLNDLPILHSLVLIRLIVPRGFSGIVSGLPYSASYIGRALTDLALLNYIETEDNKYVARSRRVVYEALEALKTRAEKMMRNVARATLFAGYYTWTKLPQPVFEELRDYFRFKGGRVSTVYGIKSVLRKIELLRIMYGGYGIKVPGIQYLDLCKKIIEEFSKRGFSLIAITETYEKDVFKLYNEYASCKTSTMPEISPACRRLRELVETHYRRGTFLGYLLWNAGAVTEQLEAMLEKIKIVLAMLRI